jgi:hypothetical protein
VVVEGHANMRFAWEKKKTGRDVSTNKRGFSHPLNLIMVAYNIVWWIPIILPFTGVIEYQTGFIAFLVVTVIRLVANIVRNNVLNPEKAVDFPLRSP